MVMDLQEQIATFAAEAATRTGRSKLEPYERLIRTLRQKRWTYAEISTALRDRFQVSATPGTVHSFMKVRARRQYPITPTHRGRLISETRPQPSSPSTKKTPWRFNVDA